MILFLYTLFNLIESPIECSCMQLFPKVVFVRVLSGVSTTKDIKRERLIER